MKFMRDESSWLVLFVGTACTFAALQFHVGINGVLYPLARMKV